MGIDIDGLVQVQPQDVNVLSFNHRGIRQLPAVTNVRFFGYRIAIERIHDASGAAREELTGWRSNGGQRIDPVPIVPQLDSRSRNNFGGSSNRELRLEDGGVAHLLHEQRNVLENISVVEAETSTQNVFSAASQVIGKTKARTEVLVVVTRLLIGELLGQRADVGDRDQLLEGAAVANGRSSDEVEVLVPTQAQVEC